MLQSASNNSTLLSGSGSAALVNLWLTQQQRHSIKAPFPEVRAWSTVEPYIVIRPCLFKGDCEKRCPQKKKAGKIRPSHSRM